MGAGARCTEHFIDNANQQGAVSNKQWCEGSTSEYIESTVLPALGWAATPAKPYDLTPTVTQPPPPSPPPPTAPGAEIAPLSAPGGGNSGLFSGNDSITEAPDGSGVFGLSGFMGASMLAATGAVLLLV